MEPRTTAPSPSSTPGQPPRRPVAAWAVVALALIAAAAAALLFGPGREPALPCCGSWSEVAATLGCSDALLVRSPARSVKRAWFSTYPRHLTVTLDTGEVRTGGPYERVPEHVRLRRVMVDGRELLVLAVGP